MKPTIKVSGQWMDNIFIEDANVECDDNWRRTLRKDDVRDSKAFPMKTINY